MTSNFESRVPKYPQKLKIAQNRISTHTLIPWLSRFCLGQPGWAGSRRNIHPLTPIVVIIHPLSASSIFYDAWHPLFSIYVTDSLFPQSLSKFSLVYRYLLAWHPPLHTPYISLPNHCLLFTAHAHTITTSFAVVLRLSHLILFSHCLQCFDTLGWAAGRTSSL